MKFTIIIPLYNKAPYIEKAIRSVFAQTYTDWELIVIDDGSKDIAPLPSPPGEKPAQWAQQPLSYLPGGERLSLSEAATQTRVYRQENVGVSVTRNRGVAMAQGQYVCFLDADDWWDEHFLQEISKAIETYPEAGIIASNYWYVKNGTERKWVKDMTTGYIDYVATYLHQMHVGGGMPLWTGAVCVQKEVLEQTGGFNPLLRLGEDFDLWIRIAHDCKVAFVDKPLAYYNQDVNVTYRATRHLHNPENTELSQYEDYLQLYDNTDIIQQLISKKRVVAWIPYLQDKQYRELAKQELQKVDWSKESKKTYRKYKLHSTFPIGILRVWSNLMLFFSRCKGKILKRKNKQ